jgi:hypothetical protein
MSDAGEKPRYGDFRDFISRDELVDAMAIVSGDRAAAEAAANEAYSDIRSCFGMAGDLVSQLCLISESTAERLRVELGETEDEARARMAAFLGRTQAMRPTVE